MAEPNAYRRPSISAWFVATLAGPWVAMLVAAALYAWIGPLHDLIPRKAFFVAAVLVGTLWSGAYALVSAAVDLALLALKLRTLPTGRAALWTSFVAPLLALATYTVHGPHRWYKFGPWAIALAVLVPLFVTSIASRVLAGRRP